MAKPRYDVGLEKYFAEQRAINKLKKQQRKLAIVCHHILFTKTPMDCILMKVATAHPMHNKEVYACEPCANLFDNLELKDTKKFQAVDPNLFKNNINRTTIR